jgi:hypothetical protein
MSTPMRRDAFALLRLAASGHAAAPPRIGNPFAIARKASRTMTTSAIASTEVIDSRRRVRCS